MNVLKDLNAKIKAGTIKRAWFDEILIRGEPGDGNSWGKVKGSHCTIATEHTNPATGLNVIDIHGPFPVAMVVGEKGIPLAEVLGALTLQQQATIETLNAEVEKRRGESEEHQKKIDELQADSAGKEARINQLEAGVKKQSAPQE